jgi:hypothetical protein
MGSSFIIRWKAEKEVNAPVIEAVTAARMVRPFSS